MKDHFNSINDLVIYGSANNCGSSVLPVLQAGLAFPVS